MTAVPAAGADGVRVCARFLTTEESEAHSEYLKALITTEVQDTIYMRTFTADWKAPHRVMRSSVEAVEAFEGEFATCMADTWNDEQYQLHRIGCSGIHEAATGNIEARAHLSGESVSGVTKVPTAVEIISELTSKAEVLLQRWR